MREELHYQLRTYLAEKRDHRCDDRSSISRELEYAFHPIHLSRSIIIAGDRLHALVQAHHDHEEHKHQPIDHPERGNRQVATIALELVIQNHHYETAGQVHQKRRETDREHPERERAVERPYPLLEMDGFFRIEKHGHLPYDSYTLAQYGS